MTPSGSNLLVTFGATKPVAIAAVPEPAAAPPAPQVLEIITPTVKKEDRKPAATVAEIKPIADEAAA